ncbi:uncharacterized protein LOC122282459 [Carya illinoinensis]|uniref:uncharacterized protein LOC122282459 n=1 Tax=Carya illinoinensis TaxID=32201 RepID=UPI001C71CF9F|nr:uncharacterized protein LOC122282459 [Carya illinoinensis]
MYACHSKRNGTSTMQNHLPSCCKNPHKRGPLDRYQKTLTGEASPEEGIGDNDGSTLRTLVTHKFSEEITRLAIAEMVIVDEMPFRVVEGQGFKKFVWSLEPWFKVPCRVTVVRDCIKLYEVENGKLKNVFRDGGMRISLTTDTWTSFSIGNLLGGKYMHMRCCAHILNLIVSEGLKEYNDAITMTRWNSTYLMLETAEKFEKAFRWMESEDYNFLSYFDDGHMGPPKATEWETVRVFVKFLEMFYEATTRFSGSLYVLIDLYAEYNVTFGSTTSTPVSQPPPISRSMNVSDGKRETKCFKEWYRASSAMGSNITQTEVDRYLSYGCEALSESFDLLTWWKINEANYPILARIARDLLAMHVSTVASESAFSTGGHVLDPFRSSLAPRIVEALICTQNWLRHPATHIDIREAMDNVESFVVESGNVFKF